MTLPASGAITFGNINTELELSATGTIWLDYLWVRLLAGIMSGAIDMNTLHGKTNPFQYTLTPPQYYWYIRDTPALRYIVWNNSVIVSDANTTDISYATGGFTYHRGLIAVIWDGNSRDYKVARVAD